MQFTVPAYPGRTFEGRITRVAPRARHPHTRTADVYASVEQPQRRAASSDDGIGRVVSASRGTVWWPVPVSAVQDFEGDTVVVTGVKARRSGMLLEALRVRVGASLRAALQN